MAAATTLISLEEYLQTPYKPDCDFVDDHLEERNVGKFDHNRMQILIATWFVTQEKNWGVIALTEQRTQVSSRRVRIPDVCLIRADVPREQVSLTPHLLCVQVLSPEDRLSRTQPRFSMTSPPWASNISGSSIPSTASATSINPAANSTRYRPPHHLR